MAWVFVFIAAILLSAAGWAFIKKVQAKTAAKNALKLKERKEDIRPVVSFYLKKKNSPSGSGHLCLHNSGSGKAHEIRIHDFNCPEEDKWCFKFQKVQRLDPGQEKYIDFDFFAGGYKASNKQEQLWMFDPDHDHGFASRIQIDFQDTDGNPYSQTIVIGKDDQTVRKKQRWIIRDAMARR